jgi:hypothetical protein
MNNRQSRRNDGEKIYLMVKYLEHIFGSNSDKDVVTGRYFDKQTTRREKQSLSVNIYNKGLYKSKNTRDKKYLLNFHQKDMPHFQRRH